MIELIVAMTDTQSGIGKDGGLPWPMNKRDMAWFKEQTMGKVVVMGSSTWDSLPAAVRPLPGRINVVLSTRSQPGADLVLAGAPDVTISTIRAAYPDKQIIVIGGGATYNAFLPLVDKVLLTTIHGDYECDTFFLSDEWPSAFTLEEEHYTDDTLTIETWKRK